jgi:hypothetical protein
MNVGIHFSNKQWERPGHGDFERLKLSQPEAIKTCLFTQVGYDQIDVHKQLRAEYPDALIVARLFASMRGGPWPAADFAREFHDPIQALQGTVEWFEVHNEPNHDRDTEGFGHTPEQFKEFNDWAIDVLGRLRANHPWAKFVFPGQLVDPGQHVDFWKANLEAIRQFDAFGVHCYWQQNNHLSRDWGACYQVAHELVPGKPIIITEFGDSTNERSPADKISFYREWYAEVDKQPYILGTAVYILGGTPDWIERPGVPNFDVTDDMARAIGRLPRAAAQSRAGVSEPPPHQPPRELAPGQVSNQDVISSFHDISLRLGLGQWDLLGQAGLSLGELVKARQAPYGGPKIDQMSGLTAEQRDLVKADLIRRAGLTGEEDDLNFDIAGGPSTSTGRLLDRPQLMGAPLGPARELRIDLGHARTGIEKRVARAWNRYGLLLLAVADELDLDPALAVAVVAVQSDRRGLAPDGRLLIRFEPQVFYQKWGNTNEEDFERHFTFDPDRPEQGHGWRPSGGEAWRDPHQNQVGEWEAFTLARALNDTAAKLSVRMGLVDTMGFNYALLGYQTVDGMFEAFATSERYQLFALFDFIGGGSNEDRRLIALRNQDLDTFAALHYGGRQAARYTITLRAAFEAFRRLSPV